jgi:UDP-N-acetylglucosamine acyltransferase
MGRHPAHLKGCNIVGLRRRGLSSDVITKINESIKLWTRTDVQKEQCLLEIESQFGEIPQIQQFVSFIRKSEIGVTR